MTLNQAVDHFGGEHELCIAIMICSQTIWNWRKKGTIPAKAQKQIEIASGGKLTPDAVKK